MEPDAVLVPENDAATEEETVAPAVPVSDALSEPVPVQLAVFELVCVVLEEGVWLAVPLSVGV